jgi:hypothetical protein
MEGLVTPRLTRMQWARAIVAAKFLAALLEKLHSASARGLRGNLALVRSMAMPDG